MYKLGCNKIIATITHDESIDRPLSITNKNGTFYYHRDHQGSIIALTDQTGAVVESFTYDNHYGIITNHTKTIETNNPYGYTARVVDTPELYYYRARYYDPELQRFISQDPIGFDSGDFNWYRYVGDSPVGLRDPWGLAPDKDKMYICHSYNPFKSFHAFLCANGKCTGLYPNPDSFFGSGYMKDETNEFDDYNCEILDDTKKGCNKRALKQCILDLFVGIKGVSNKPYLYYSLFHNNCRTAATAVAVTCQIQNGCY